MSADSKTLATFKIDKNNWLDFQALAKANENNATKLLRGFIAACLDGRIDFESLQTIEQPTFNIDEQITAALSPLLAVITGMKADIEVLKVKMSISPKIVKKEALQGASTPFQVDSYQKENRTPSRAYTPKPLLGLGDAFCLHCGSSALVRKGKSESVDKNGFSGRRVKCKSCGKGSTLWEAK